MQMAACVPSSSGITDRLFGFGRLVVIQIVIPNLSFLGHLSGILAGTMQMHGCLPCMFCKSLNTLRRIDESWPFSHASSFHSSFVPTPQGALEYYDHITGNRCIYRLFMGLVETGSQVFEALKNAIFGERSPVTLGHSDDESDGWSGLPPDEEDGGLTQQLV